MEKNQKYELFASQVEIFEKSFYAYLEQYKKHEPESNNESANPDGINVFIFEELLCNYYKTVISALKKLAAYDNKHIPVLIETYQKLWTSAPRLKEKNYICPYLFDLCKFLYEIKKPAALTFFYNLLIYCRDIPFLTLNDAPEKSMADAYKQNGEEDPFAYFRKERAERTAESFDEAFFYKSYKKFFLILSGWREKIDGYYTKDEIYFMNGLFIMDELSDCVYSGEKTIKTEKYSKKINRKEIFREYYEAGKDGKIYEYVYGGEINKKILDNYKKALKYFNLAIGYNPNNPRYYYEYGRCLKNSGKSGDAEIFFKKAFDLNG